MKPLGQRSKKVVVVDDDRDVAELVQAVLSDEGFAISCLYDIGAVDVRATLEKLAPDCVLLDGGHLAEYGGSWDVATWLSSRSRPVPVVMLTGHTRDREEVVANVSDRSKTAAFVGVIPKPFDIDLLVITVRRALGMDAPPRTDAEESQRTQELVARLAAAAVEDLKTSEIGREWVTFRAGRERVLYKIYRWRAADVYFVGRYSPTGHQLEPFGQFYDLDALIGYCLDEIERGRVRS